MIYQAKGIQAWFLQRVSAIYMALYMVYFLWTFFNIELLTFQIWLNWLSHPIMNMATGVFFLLFAVHAWVGMRDIVLDYIPNDSWRFISLVGIGLFILASSLEVIRILFSLAFNV